MTDGNSYIMVKSSELNPPKKKKKRSLDGSIYKTQVHMKLTFYKDKHKQK